MDTISFSKNDAQRRLVEGQRLSKLINHVSLIREMNTLRIIHEANKCGRSHGRLGAVVKLYAPATVHGRFMLTNDGFEDPVEPPRGDPRRVLLIHRLDRVEDLKRSLARQG